MRNNTRCNSLRLLLGLGAILVSRTATGELVPDFSAAVPTSNGCDYSYSVSITEGTKVSTGDYFTVYDFHGYVTGSAYAPADWVISVQNTGTTPFGVDVRAFLGDSASSVNLTFTYVGGASIIGPTLIGGSSAFGAETTQCQPGLGGYSSSVHIFAPGRLYDDLRKPSGGYTVTPFLESLSALTISPNLVAGKLPSTGTVKLDGPAPLGGAKILLKSSNTLVATVPGSVTVADGDTSATFSISTKAVSSLTSVVISGSYQGVTKNATLKVRPIGVAKLTFIPTSVPGGSTSTGTVTLEATAAPGDITVTLTSANPSVANPAVASFVIPAGSLTGTFKVNTSVVSANTGVKITAAANGISKSATLTVTK